MSPAPTAIRVNDSANDGVNDAGAHPAAAARQSRSVERRTRVGEHHRDEWRDSSVRSC